MRKIYLLIALAAAISAHAKTYTFADLAAIDGLGIVTDSDGAYVISPNNDLTSKDTLKFDDNRVMRTDHYILFADGTTLQLRNGETVRFGEKMQIRFSGVLDADVDGSATLTTTADATNSAIGLFLYGDNAAASLRNLTFEYVGITFGSTGGSLVAENCEFLHYNGKNGTMAAVNFSAVGAGNIIKNCRFIEGTSGAIASGSNTPVGIQIIDSYFYHNTTANRNRPQINLTGAGANDIIISGNTIIGGKFNLVGGLSISNMLNMASTCQITIKNNRIEDNRYGVNVQGKMNADLINNEIINNCYESNPNAGGSGITVYNNTQATYIEGNRIEGNLWGITLVGTTDNVNIGRLEAADGSRINPGGNVFVNNGNNDVLYDLYNNTANLVYAQGNRWNVAVQDEPSIEQVIVHKADNESLGEVIFMPADTQSGISTIAAELPCADIVAVYDVAGRLVAHGSVNIAALPTGTYVARTANGKAIKFAK